MGWRSFHGSYGCWATALSLLQISLAVAIAIVVRHPLWAYTGSFSWAPSWWSTTSATNVCLMSTTSANLCAYTYVVVGVSLVASTLVLLTQFLSCGRGRRCCGCMESLLALFLTAWWLAAAAVATIYGTRADGAQPPLPEQAARTAVWAMGWAEAGLWGLSWLLALVGRRAARRRGASTELSASMAGATGRYSRYDDTPFTSRSSKWKEARDAYVARSSDSEVARPLSPRSKAARLAASKSLDL